MKKNMVRIIIRILLVAVVIAIIYGAYLYNTTGVPDTISAKQVTDILNDYGIQSKNITEETIEENPSLDGLLNCLLIAEKGDVKFEFYSFNDTKRPLLLFREVKNKIYVNDLTYPNIEIETTKHQYRVYELETKECFTGIIYLKNTAVYMKCNIEHASHMKSILSDMGYADTRQRVEEPAWTGQLTTVIFYVLLFPVVLISRNFCGQGMYLSAAVKKEQLNGKSWKERRRFLVKYSKRSNSTKIWNIIYKVHFYPWIIGITMAAISFFVPDLKTVADSIALMFMGAILVSIYVELGFLHKYEKENEL